MNLDQDFFQVSKLREDRKKKGLHQKWNTFFPRIQRRPKTKKGFTRNGTLFPPNSSTDLRSDAHQSQIIGGDADKDHTQIVGGDTIKLLGEIYPPIHPGFRHPGHE